MRNNTVGVIGLGYVGLPLAMEFCRSGFTVFGVDTSQQRLDRLRHGDSYIVDVRSQDVQEFVSSGRLCPSAEFSTLREAEGISICVPTPLRKTKLRANKISLSRSALLECQGEIT